MERWGNRFTLMELIILMVVMLVFCAMMAPAIDRFRDAAKMTRWQAYQRDLAQDDNALVYYTFERGSGLEIENRAVAPQSYRQYDPRDYSGTLSGDVTWTQGRWGRKRGLNFDGDEDFVNCNSFDINRNHEAVAAMTILVWFKPDELTRYNGCLISKTRGRSRSDHWFMLAVSGDRKEAALRFLLKTEDGRTTDLVSDHFEYKKGEWMHCAAVYDGSEMRLYLNARPIGFERQSGAVSRHSMVRVFIGDTPQGGQGIRGTIDELAIFNAALSDEDIYQHYTIGRP